MISARVAVARGDVIPGPGSQRRGGVAGRGL